MRLRLDLQPKQDSYLDESWRHKFRGVLYNNITNTDYHWVHNYDVTPFNFSNFYEREKEYLQENNIYHITITSFFDGLLQNLKKNLKNTIHIGDYSFIVKNSKYITEKLPESGTIETKTAIYCEVPSDYDTATYWKPDHGLDKFIQIIENDLDNKIDALTKYNSDNRGFTIFNELSFINTYSKPLQINTDTTHTLILSKWNLNYTIQNDLHKEYIKIALQTGLGGYNSLGLGYLYIQ